MTFRDAANKFVELTTWIRELSSPQLTDIDTPESYREKLLVNFRRIGDISQINAGLLKDYILPVLEKKELLTEEEISVLQGLKENLLDAYKMENLDAPFIYQIALRMCEDAVLKHDKEAIILALDDFVMASYALLAMIRRIYPYSDSATRCRERGLDAAKGILEYLPPEKLATLEEGPAREAVLINARYIMTLYEYPLTKEDENITEHLLGLLRRALSLMENPEYAKLVPDFDWAYHEFRTLHYYSVMTIFNNMYGFNKDQLVEINDHAKRLLEVWEKGQDDLKAYNNTETMEFAAKRCAYLNGEMSLEEYKKELYILSRNVQKDIYNADEMQLHTSIPVEYLLQLDPNNVSKADGEIINEFYKKLVRYIHRMPKMGHLSFLLSELIYLLKHFIEVDGGIDFETMCMELLAAIHPPTYVHSLSVADLSACLAKHLFDKHPEMFENSPGYPEIEAIKENIWHAAACHDIGKLSIVETIITYGRPLYDHEFKWIQSHPEAGADLLARHEDTKAYAEVALGHQRWYDGKGGYPEAYKPEEAKNRIFVDLVACADCLDAATDSVGRSYKQGKTLDQFIEELKEGLGSRYAPFLLELFEDETVYKELESILNGGRDDKYRHTYTILSDMID